MASDDEALRWETLDWLERDAEGQEALLALGRLLRARGQAFAAQATAIKAMGELLEASGGVTGLRARLAAAANDALDDLGIGGVDSARDLNAVLSEFVADSDEWRAAFRAALACLVLACSAVLGPRLAALGAAGLLEPNAGRKSLLAPVPRPGGKQDDAMKDALRMSVAALAGRKAGWRYGDAPAPIPREFWDEGADTYNAGAKGLRDKGHDCPPIKPLTLKDLCLSEGAVGDHFKACRWEGAADRQAGKPEP